MKYIVITVAIYFQKTQNMKKCLQTIIKYTDWIFRQIFIFFIKIYQWTLSPDKSPFFSHLKWRICCHHPHCSEYGLQVLRKYNIFSSLYKIMDRISRCNGAMSVNYDPSALRVGFMCSAPIWVPFLQEIANDENFDLACIVTMPDAPVGRGLKMQENIIKTEAKKIFSDSKYSSVSKILVLHGFGSHSQKPWFQRTKEYFGDKGIDVQIPNLPNSTEPNLQEQMDFLISKYGKWINDKTMIIWHSLGGFLAGHLIAWLWTKISKLLLIAPAMPGKDYLKDIEPKNPKYEIFFKWAKYLDKYVNWHEPNFEILHKLIDEVIVFHSKDDPIVSFEMSNKYYQNHFPNAKFVTFEDRWHFNSSRGTSQIPEIADFVFEFDDKIKTPIKINPDKSDEWIVFADWLRSQSLDYLVVIAYGKILPQSILDIPKIMPVNVHGSILPKLRWASPIQSVFLEEKNQNMRFFYWNF